MDVRRAVLHTLPVGLLLVENWFRGGVHVAVNFVSSAKKTGFNCVSPLSDRVRFDGVGKGGDEDEPGAASMGGAIVEPYFAASDYQWAGPQMLSINRPGPAPLDSIYESPRFIWVYIP